ncbi:MAG TPA: sigma-70 family RNA polymerase sigma factor [Gemmatimonadaceae bacterium]|nr:sigma-70 family RNA polymerase sigma factor [Gemmatimonadaceae bacterium]
MPVPSAAPPPRDDEGAAPRPAADRDARRDDEPQLVARLRAGETAAFDVLVRRYLPRALAVARRLLGDAHDAEDLVQDAFLRALDKIDRCDPERGFGPWFFRLLVNAGLSARKARARRTTDAEDPDAPSLEAGPLEQVERGEVRDRFRAALARLSPRQRLIVEMFEMDGLATHEIAAALAVTPETVRWHLHQARRTLRVALAPLDE